MTSYEDWWVDAVGSASMMLSMKIPFSGLMALLWTTPTGVGLACPAGPLTNQTSETMPTVPTCGMAMVGGTTKYAVLLTGRSAEVYPRRTNSWCYVATTWDY